MSTTRPALAKDARRTLLDQLAAKRRQQQQQSQSSYADLEDSSSDEESFTTARSTQQQPVVLDDSEEEENQRPWQGATSRPTATGGSKLNRLRKAGAGAPPPAQPQALHTAAADMPDDSDDDIAVQLGGLSIKGKSGSSGSGSNMGSGAAAPGARPAAPSKPPTGRAELSDSVRSSTGKEEADKQGDDKCLVLGERGQFKLNAKASTMLYPHQVEGVKWLWSLYKLERGGILADDMGLGKTIQCAAFLAGLIESRLIRRAIVVAPKTLLAQWRKELDVCGLKGQTHEYGGSATERENALDRVVRRRGVLLTTYGMVLHNAEVLAEHDDHDPDDGPMWDVMICDEGHKLKNPRMQLRKQLDALPVALRIIISGTPIQNNLLEMWALFNFCAPDLLGEAADFRDHYEKVITNGSDKHATEYERERGAVAAARLRQEIGPYMLRREKKEVFKSADASAAPGAAPASGAAAEAAAAAGDGQGGSKPSTMPHKNDLIVWLKLKPMQRKVYQAFLNSDSVKKVFNQTASALAAITVLKKVCDHPALLSERAAHGIVSGVNRARRQAAARLEGGGSGYDDSDVEEIEDSSAEEEELLDSEEGEWESDSEDYSSDEDRQRARKQKQKQHAAKAKAGGSGGSKRALGPEAGVGAGGEEEWLDWASAELEQKLLDEVHTTGFAASCKTVFVMGLLKNLVAEGHRTLIFSQSRVMLNILEAAIKEERWRYCRIDGSVASAAEREARVRQFQTSSSIPIFLLTSQVGGLGLTLTAADRVIILDPAWNPSTDNQSVDRAYRIGQKRDVVVYRLISCGTVEEKIYRRQVFKGGLSRTGMEEGEQFRYFAQQDLRDLFRLEPSECERSRTQQELHDMHAHQRRETPELRHHLEFLRTLECYAGVSDHDLLFSKKEREADRPGTRAQPVASSAASGSRAGASVGGSSARPPARSGSVFSKTATQGWSGGSDIADLFAKKVSLGGSGAGGTGAGAAAVAAAARPPGSSGPGGACPYCTMGTYCSHCGGGAASGSGSSSSAAPKASPKDPRQERIKAIQEELEKKRFLLNLAGTLVDGGAKVRGQIAELERQLLEAKREGASASASASISSAPAASAPWQSAAVTSTGAAAPAAAPAPQPAAEPVHAATAAATTTVQPRSSAVSGSSSSAGAHASAKPNIASLLAAATAAPLPSGQEQAAAAAGSLQSAAPPAAPAARTAEAPLAAAPVAKPSASPLLARMFGMWGSSKKQAPSSSRTAGEDEVQPADGSGRVLSFGGADDAFGRGQQQAAAPSSSSSGDSVVDLSGDDAAPRSGPGAPPQVHSWAAVRGEAGPSAAAAGPAAVPPPQRQQQRQQQAGVSADGSRQGASAAAAPPKQAQQLSVREIKARLMEVCQAIKEAESGGYFQRDKMEKLRRRAEKLTQQYNEAKARRDAEAANS